MVGGDEDAIVAGEGCGAERDRALVRKIVVAHFVECGKVRIVVIDLAPRSVSSSMILSEGDSRRSSTSFL